MNIATAIEAARLAIATAEGLKSAIDRAKDAIDSSTEQLKASLADLEKMQEQLASDRKGADTALDDKFRGKS
jgi:hypothetical protein